MKDSFSTNPEIEIFKSLEFTIEQLTICKNDPYHWKWAIIGIHYTLQISMATALRDYVGNNILRKKKQKIYQKLLNNENDTLPAKLNYFLELYKDIKSEKPHKNNFENKYIPLKDDDINIKKLNELRNKFSHFIPSGDEYDVSENLNLFYTAHRLLRNIVVDNYNIIGWLSNKKTQIIELLNKLELILNEFKNELNSTKKRI